MRMNQGTILLLLVSLIIIIAVLVLTINQAAAPGTNATAVAQAEETPVALFPGASTESIVRLEVRDDLTGDRIVLVKSGAEGGEWALESAQPAEGAIDQTQADSLTTSLFTLQAQESFEVDELEQYGLTNPSYSVYAVADDGAIHVMHIGSENPAGTRFYTVVEQLAAGTTRPDLDMMQPLLERADVDTSLTEDEAPVQGGDGIATLPADLAADPTLAALAETMQAEEDEAVVTELAATYSAIIEATNAAGGMGTSGNVPGGVAVDATGEATAEGTAPAADAADAENAMDPIVERADVETSLTTDEPAAIDQTDATPTANLTEEATVEATAEPPSEPLVTLEGPQTIHLVNAQPLRALIAAISQPPIALPLEGPTETPPPLIPEELTDEAPAAGVPDATAEATEAAA